MSKTAPAIGRLHAALAPHGLLVLGIAAFAGSDGPRLADGNTAGSVALIGNAGGSYWAEFCRWRESRADRKSDGTDPLDSWSKAMIGPIAASFGATAYFPSDPPYQPFQRWAMQAEGLRAGPLGLLMHPRHGPWQSYRGALGFAGQLEPQASAVVSHPCDHCPEKPCILACPPKAVGSAGMDVPACRQHLASDAGKAGCRISGCRARNACPVGAGFRYSQDQQRFHMDALTG
ncbi:ferredoxin [Rhizobium halophytocola]|uniref:Ferredoxin n=1 Tax=Rhizobium halophytocola TaxID=735519 RepID=A0ABS4DZU6_9HYPH|nr:ferredoxin [Rhizobium halophytocola]MBP1851221.1 hypothetical protein [Rhizobium halophytocola]